MMPFFYNAERVKHHSETLKAHRLLLNVDANLKKVIPGVNAKNFGTVDILSSRKL